jgi:succinyl-diaminopimelate desuccinylase
MGKPADEIKKADVVEICQDLVRIDTIDPPGNELAVAEYCRDFLKPLGFEINLIMHSENRASLLGCRKGIGQLPGVLICAHMDTVPVGEVKWKHDPLGGELADGKVWGRGASDMKSGLAVTLAAARELVESGIPLKGNLWIGLTAGEEVDLLGSKAIAKHREMLPLQVLLVPEPSSNEIYLAQKGALWLEVSMLGKIAHGSMPELGINAVESMSQFISGLKTTDFPFNQHPLLDDYSVAVTTIKGGSKINVVPDECTTTIDIRTVPGQDHKVMLDMITRLLNRLEEDHPGLKTRIMVLNDYPAVVTEANNPIVFPMLEAACSVLDHQVPIKGVKFYTDSAVLTPELEVPMIICGPGHASLAHQTDENVEVNMLRDSVQIYARALANYLG